MDAGGEYGGLAVDGGTLFYQGDKGLVARSLATGQEQVISATGQNPIAADGVLLWSETQSQSRVGPFESSLHMLKYSGNTQSTEGTVVAAGTGTFSGYHVSGDNIVWSFLPPAGDMRVYLYTLSTSAKRAISPAAASNPLISGSLVAWTEKPSGGAQPPTQWSIKSYNISTGAVSTVLPEGNARVDAWAIVGQRVAYTVESNAGSGTKELYTTNLGLTR